MTREEAIEQLKWYFECDDGTGSDASTKKAYELAIEALKRKNRRKGKWIVKTEGPYLNKIGYCSRCRYATSLYQFCDCCPHCGAKMEGEE